MSKNTPIMKSVLQLTSRNFQKTIDIFRTCGGINTYRIMGIFILIVLLIPSANAAITQWQITPENPAIGDVINVTGLASSSEVISAKVSFIDAVTSSYKDGKWRYEYLISNVTIPDETNSFTVNADGVKDIYIKAQLNGDSSWSVALGADASGGKATIVQSNVPGGTHNIKIYGTAATQTAASTITLGVIAQQPITADSSGIFEYNFDTSSMSGITAGTRLNVTMNDQGPLTPPGVEVTADSPAKSGMQNSEITYVVTVSNTGTMADTYNISVTNTDGVQFLSLDNATLTIDAGGNAATTLHVSDARIGSYRTIVTATSQTDINITNFTEIITNVTAIPASPSIVSSPASPVSDVTGASRTFTITANQIVDVTWTVDGTAVHNDSNVINSTYANTSAIVGTHAVVAIATNTNGSVTSTWTWNVNTVPVDTTAPVITLSGTSPVTIEVGSVYIDSGATATDNHDGDLTASIVTVNPVNTAILGTYTITYNVNDSSNNAATQVTRSVIVEDTTVPVITILGTSFVTIEIGSVYTDSGAIASDNYDGNLTSSIVTINHVDNTTVGTYIVTYNVNDSSNNAAVQITRTIYVVDTTSVDTTAPIITILGTSPVTIEVGSVYIDSGATASDNHDGNLTTAIVTVNPVNTAILGTYTITYNVNDSSNNAATQVTRSVIVEDTTVPVITILGASPVTIEVGSVYIDSGATASDNYDGNLTTAIVTVNPVNTAILGTYTITYNVEDSSNNAATQITRSVNVADTTAPSLGIIYPVDGANVTTPKIIISGTASDEIAVANVSVNGITATGTANWSVAVTLTEGSNPLTIIVTDTSGNTAIDSITITYTPAISALIGDVNGDGILSSVDALIALQMSAGNIAETLVADVNGDGNVTSLDALIILQASVGVVELQLGDVNGDGILSSVDALMALQMSAGNIAQNTAVADVNGDGNVTSMDALMILQASVGAIVI